VTAAKTRSVAIDLVRVVAIVGVVARHVWYDPDGIVAQVICPWAIAVFFVLTGYLWSSKRDLEGEIRNRFRNLLIPYMAWMVVISVPFFTWAFFHFPDKTLGVIGLLIATIYGAQLMVVPFSACWFFTTMFFTAVLARYLESRPRWVTWAVLGVTLVVTSTIGKILWYLPLGIGLAFPCLLFVVFGQELRRQRAHITRPFATGLLLIGIGALAVVLGASHNLNGVLIEVKNSTYGFPVAGLVSGAIIGLGLVLVAEGVDPIVPRSIGPAVVQIATTSTFVMFLHPCILFMIRGDSDNGSWIQFLAALLGSFALALLCLRLRIFPWLTGVWAPQRPAKSAAQDQAVADPATS
jgi:acyltransferase